MQNWLLSWGEQHHRGDKEESLHDERSHRIECVQFIGHLLFHKQLNPLCIKTVNEYIFAKKEFIFITKDFIGLIRYDLRKLAVTTHIENPLCEELKTLATFNQKAIICSSNATFVAAKDLKKSLFEDNSIYYASINCIDVTPDQNYFASGGMDGSVIIWSKHFSVIKRLYGHREEVKFVKFAQDEKNNTIQLFSIGSDGVIFRWNPLAGKMLGSINYSQGISVQIFEVAFKSALIAIAYNNPVIALYRCYDSDDVVEDVYNKKILHLQQIRIITLAHQGMPTIIKFTEDAKWVISSSEDEKLLITLINDTNVRLVCDKFTTTRSCLSFLNTITGFEIIAEPPKSSVFIIIASTSDGRIVKWVSDPRDVKKASHQILQLHFGSLLSIKLF